MRKTFCGSEIATSLITIFNKSTSQVFTVLVTYGELDIFDFSLYVGDFRDAPLLVLNELVKEGYISFRQSGEKENVYSLTNEGRNAFEEAISP